MGGVGGASFLKAASGIRQSRSLPHLHRHAHEAALASHVVRARGVLAKWQQGQREIREARDHRDATALTAALETWRFAEDEEEVVRAREDLERWASLEDTLVPLLDEAIEAKDIVGLRETLKELSALGKRNIDGSAEARALVQRYDKAIRALSAALEKHDVPALVAILEAWEFDHLDPLIEKAQA